MMIITDCVYDIVGGERLDEMRAGGANEVDVDWCDVASFDKSRGSVGDGREKGSCCNGEDLHVDWIWERWGFFERGFVVDWYVWEGFVWYADEMEVCRGYVGVFIDSPDSQTHDPSPSRNYAKDWRAFLLLRWASGINSPHPSQDGWTRHHCPHYSILWPSSVLAQRLRVRLYPSKVVTSIVKKYDLPHLDRWQSPTPRSQQIGMGGWFLTLSTNKKTYDIENVCLDITWAGDIGMSMGCAAAVWRVELIAFFILDFDNEKAVQWGLHMLKPQHRLECEWLLRAGLIRKDLHLHNNLLIYFSLCFDYGEPWECKSTNRVLIVQEVILLYIFSDWSVSKDQIIARVMKVFASPSV